MNATEAANTPQTSPAVAPLTAQCWESGRSTGERENSKKEVESGLLGVSTQRRLYLWPQTRNEKLSVQKECIGQGRVQLEKGALVRA